MLVELCYAVKCWFIWENNWLNWWLFSISFYLPSNFQLSTTVTSFWQKKHFGNGFIARIEEVVLSFLFFLLLLLYILAWLTCAFYKYASSSRQFEIAESGQDIHSPSQSTRGHHLQALPDFMPLAIEKGS